VNGTELKNWKGNILELIEGWEENETMTQTCLLFPTAGV
jgi:hypothetical protein